MLSTRAPLRRPGCPLARPRRLPPSPPRRLLAAAAESESAAASQAQPAPPASLVSRSRALSAALEALDVPLARQRLVVLGPTSDVAAVRLFLAALESDACPDPPPHLAFRLARGLADLESLRAARASEAAFYEAQSGGVSSPLLDGSGLTDAEKLGLSGAISGGIVGGVQGGVWSSFLLLGGGLLALLLFGDKGGGGP